MKEWTVMAAVSVHLVGKVITVISVSTMEVTKEEVYYYILSLVVNSTICNSTCHEFA